MIQRGLRMRLAMASGSKMLSEEISHAGPSSKPLVPSVNASPGKSQERSGVWNTATASMDLLWSLVICMRNSARPGSREPWPPVARAFA